MVLVGERKGIWTPNFKEERDEERRWKKQLIKDKKQAAKIAREDYKYLIKQTKQKNYRNLNRNDDACREKEYQRQSRSNCWIFKY